MRRPKSGWKQWNADLADSLWSLFWWFVVPLLCVTFLFYGAQDIGPAWSAKLGHGIAGTFTAENLSCGRVSCQWHGTFRSDDGGINRVDVAFGSGAPDLTRGQMAPALDTGDRIIVYPIGGGWDWLIVTVLLVGAAGFLVAWVVTVRRRRARHPVPPRRRRRTPRRDDRFVIGPERRLGGRYVLRRIPAGLTLTAKGWGDVVSACAEHRVSNVVIDPSICQRLLEEWGPPPDDVPLPG